MKNFKRIYSSLFTIAIVAFGLNTVSAQEIDLLLKGGHVIDPKNKINTKMDIAITGGKIVKVATNIPSGSAKKTVDVSGLYVSPGIIDMHTHVFQGNDLGSYIANGQTAVPADAFTFRAGVTTVVDAGSSGWRNFRLFKEQNIDRSQTRILALLNITGTGMHSRFEEQDKSDFNPEMTAYMITKLFPEIIVGIKASHYWGDFTQVDKAVEAGKLAKVPVMVDFGEHQPTNSIKSLFLEHLRPGDIFTHTFAYGPDDRETIADDKGIVKPFVFEAQKRGIIFDVGHGGGAFFWRQAIPAIQQGFKPNVISTDLHSESMNGGMKDMANVMSKFLNIGMSLQEVITCSTMNPANVIHRPDLGNLSVGSDADIAVFSLKKGNFGYTDVRKNVLKGTQKLDAELTIRAGKIVWDLNGVSGQIWDSPEAINK